MPEFTATNEEINHFQRNYHFEPTAHQAAQSESNGRKWDWHAQQNLPSVINLGKTSQSTTGTSSFQRPIPSVYLDAPNTISKPLESPAFVVLPGDVYISPGLQQLLTFFACSDEGLHLLPTSEFHNTEAFAIKSVQTQLDPRSKLFQHLSAVVEQLRSSGNNEPLRGKYIQDLGIFLERSRINLNNSGHELYQSLLTLAAQPAPTPPASHPRQTSIKQSPVQQSSIKQNPPKQPAEAPTPYTLIQNKLLSKPVSLAPATPVEIDLLDDEDCDIEISRNDLVQLNSLQVTLYYIAQSPIWDQYLVKTLSSHPTERPSETALKNSLQAHLCGIVHAMRSQQESGLLAPLCYLKQLLEMSGCRNFDAEFTLEQIGKLLGLGEETLLKAKRAIKWCKVEMYSPLDKAVLLPKACDSTMSRPLTNLGSTCYLNALLQLIARFSCFDEMLTRPIEISDAGASPEQAVIKKQQQALQHRLRKIIAFMRKPENLDPIPRGDLEILYQLLQINGWHHLPTSQQDPLELLTFLQDTLGAQPSKIDLIEKYTYQDKDGINQTFCKTATLADLQIPLPIDQNKQLVNEFDSMDKLLDNYTREAITGDNAWIPEGKTERHDLQKVSHIVGTPPNTLFIQEKRFGFSTENFTSFRICGSVPFSPTISLPVYDQDDLAAPPTYYPYQLKAVIGHHGGASSNSGHYTTWALQQVADENNWIKYDDDKFELFETWQTGIVERDISEKSYYLAYTLIQLQDSPVYY